MYGNSNDLLAFNRLFFPDRSGYFNTQPFNIVSKSRYTWNARTIDHYTTLNSLGNQELNTSKEE